MASDVLGELGHGSVAAGAVLLHRLECDGIQVAGELAAEAPGIRAPIACNALRVVSQRAQSAARLARLPLSEDPPEIVTARRAELLRRKGEIPGEQPVEDDSKRVDVGPGVD